MQFWSTFVHIQTFLHSFIYLFIHSFIHSFFHSFIHSFIHSYWFIHSVNLFNHIHSFIHSFCEMRYWTNVTFLLPQPLQPWLESRWDILASVNQRISITYSNLYVAPVSTTRWLNAGLMLAQRRRRWADISPALGQRLGAHSSHDHLVMRLSQCKVFYIFTVLHIMLGGHFGNMQIRWWKPSHNQPR